MVANAGGGQGEKGLARLVRGNGCDASRTQARLARLRFSTLMSGDAIRAAVTTVCAFADVAGVGRVGAIRGHLACFGILFGMAVIAVGGGSGGTALLVSTLFVRSLDVSRRRSTRRRVLSVSGLLLLLSESWWAAAAGPRTGGGSMGRVGLLASGGTASRGPSIAGHPKSRFVIAAGAAGGDSVTTTVSTAFAVGFEAALVLQGGAVLPQLQAGSRRPAAGLLVSRSAGGAQFGGGRRVWFTNLRAGLS